VRCDDRVLLDSGRDCPGCEERQIDRRAQRRVVAAAVDAAMPHASETERRAATEQQLHQDVTARAWAKTREWEQVRARLTAAVTWLRALGQRWGRTSAPDSNSSSSRVRHGLRGAQVAAAGFGFAEKIVHGGEVVPLGFAGVRGEGVCHLGCAVDVGVGEFGQHAAKDADRGGAAFEDLLDAVGRQQCGQSWPCPRLSAALRGTPRRRPPVPRSRSGGGTTAPRGVLPGPVAGSTLWTE
jgi:hypothetical protein